MTNLLDCLYLSLSKTLFVNSLFQTKSDYLTGFRKRNLQKKEAAKNNAKRRQHQLHLEARRQHRQALKDQAKQNAALAENAYRKGT